jgi:hypothetical protein
MKLGKLWWRRRGLYRQTPGSEEAGYSSRLIDGLSTVTWVFRPGFFHSLQEIHARPERR